MSDRAESELIALVAQEQKGLRGILVAGFSALFLVVAMSVALGAYYFFVAQSLAADSQRLERRAFETRILADDLADRISDQEAAIRRNYAEMLSVADEQALDPEADAPIEAARAFLDQGRRSLSGEKRLERALQAESGARSALIEGVLALIEWERSGQVIQRGVQTLPARLQDAQSYFSLAAGDDELGALAKTGLAWIEFENASSPRSNYNVTDCDAVFARTNEIGAADALGPQPLYWRGQCGRKLGRVQDALNNYSLAVQSSQSVALPATASLGQREAQMLLEMNAHHGLGTVLIAAANLPDDTALSSARELASAACDAQGVEEGVGQTKLMHACLQKAMVLRRSLGQTENQVSGSRENLSFVYLIDNDFEGAFENATAVERTGLFPWNELIRATVAAEINAIDAADNARRNVSLFNADQFNMCEIRKLLKPEHFELAYAVLKDEHPEFEMICT